MKPSFAYKNFGNLQIHFWNIDLLIWLLKIDILFIIKTKMFTQEIM